MKKQLFALLLVLFIAACETIIDVNIPNTEKKLVLNATISPDSLIVINLSKSLHILDNEAIRNYVANANVKIYEDEAYMETMTYQGNGNYKTQLLKPQVQCRYRVEVKLKDEEQKYIAEDLVPERILIANLDTVSFFSPQKTGILCKITFDDMPHKKNYYFLQVSAFQVFNTTNLIKKTGSQFYKNIPITSDDPIIKHEQHSALPLLENQRLVSGGLVFSDEIIDGMTSELSFKINSQTFAEVDTSKFYVHLNSISKNYFLYLKSHAKYINSFENPLSEPVQVFSNVSRGLGVFVAHTVSVDSFTVVK